MATPDVAYNYEHYDFALEPPEYQRWLVDAPRLSNEAPDFELPTPSGDRVSLRSLRGAPVVLEFGSYTCPIFCAQIPPMEDLADRHPGVAFLVVYTREAHPGEQISAHSSDDDKATAAKLLLRDEEIRRILLLDDVTGTVHRAYGEAWDSVFVLDAAGRVVLRRAWNDPTQVGVVLETLAAGEAPSPFESIDMVPTASPGGMGHGLLRGGTAALLDFFDSAPPPLQLRLRQSTSDQVRQILAERRPEADPGGAAE